MKNVERRIEQLEAAYPALDNEIQKLLDELRRFPDGALRVEKVHRQNR